MKKAKLIDTMRDFIMYWKNYSEKSGEEMFHGWLTEYIMNYPEILIVEATYRKSLDNLKNMMVEGILSKINDLIHGIIEGWMTFLENFEDVYSLAVEEFQENLEPIFAIYVGSGWRPRWTSMILDKPALIIDLGSVAELKLTGRSEMRGLLAFNLGHLYHMWKRDELNRLKESREDPFFRLYAEGFAQLSEHLILKRESWHMVRSEGWLKACEEREGMLAEEYLRSAEAGDVEAFYDPWLDVGGLRLAGKYLGYRFVESLREEGLTLEEVAGFSESDVLKLSRAFLEELAENHRSNQL